MTTHIQAMKAQYAANREKVLALLGWDMLQYGTLQYETGLQYLRQYLQLDEATANMFERSPRWWSWWINQWNLRDAQVFLPEVPEVPELQALKAEGAVPDSFMDGFYHTVHDIRTFDRYPHAHLMHESYDAMTRKLYAQLKKEKVCTATKN